MAARTTLDEVSAAGAFVRTASTLTSAPGLSAEWPAEAGRYVLYVARACPWASRVLATLALRGLDHAIAVTNVAPVWQHTKPGVDGHRGWVFRARAAKGSADESLAYVPLADPLTGAETLRGVYEAVAPPETPKFTVPLLVCARTRKAVCNESAVLTRAFDAPAWDAIARFPAVRLAPAALLPDIDAANDAMYETINNGVYKCGFAVSQAAYDAAAAAAAAAFDSFAARLERAPFLVGGRLTESDIRLYLTLIRWDPVYVSHFKTSFRSVRETPSLIAFLRRVGAAAGAPGGATVLSTVDLDNIKRHYFGSHHLINPHGIVPRPAAREGEELGGGAPYYLVDADGAPTATGATAGAGGVAVCSRCGDAKSCGVCQARAADALLSGYVV